MGYKDKIKILIAEDDRISLESLKEVLRADNIEILFAANGKEAVRKCREHRDIDLVLMDIKMPEMDGKEAARHIKSIRPELPIVAQTAYALDDERDTILHEGFDAYIAKPIRHDNIISIIDQFNNKS